PGSPLHSALSDALQREWQISDDGWRWLERWHDHAPDRARCQTGGCASVPSDWYARADLQPLHCWEGKVCRSRVKPNEIRLSLLPDRECANGKAGCRDCVVVLPNCPLSNLPPVRARWIVPSYYSLA